MGLNPALKYKLCLLLHAELQVQIANLDDNLMIVGIEEDGNEIVLPPEIIRRTGNREGIIHIGQHIYTYLISLHA